jgi:hypothetical protein
VQIATAINKGESPSAELCSSLRDFTFTAAKDDESASNTITELVSRSIPLWLGVDPIKDIQGLENMS